MSPLVYLRDGFVVMWAGVPAHAAGREEEKDHESLGIGSVTYSRRLGQESFLEMMKRVKSMCLE